MGWFGPQLLSETCRPEGKLVPVLELHAVSSGLLIEQDDAPTRPIEFLAVHDSADGDDCADLHPDRTVHSAHVTYFGQNLEAAAVRGVLAGFMRTANLCGRPGWSTQVIASGGGSRTGSLAALPEHPEGIKLLESTVLDTVRRPAGRRAGTSGVELWPPLGLVP